MNPESADLDREIIKMDRFDLVRFCDKKSFDQQKEQINKTVKVSGISVGACLISGFLAFALGFIPAAGVLVESIFLVLVVIFFISLMMSLYGGAIATTETLAHKKIAKVKRLWDEKVFVKNDVKKKYLKKWSRMMVEEKNDQQK